MKIIKEYLIIIILSVIVLSLTVLNIILLNKKVTCEKTIKTDNYTITHKNIIGFKSENMIIEIASDNKDILEKEQKSLKNEQFKINLENNEIIAKKSIKFKNRKSEVLNYKKDGFKCN